MIKTQVESLSSSYDTDSEFKLMNFSMVPKLTYLTLYTHTHDVLHRPAMLETIVRMKEVNR